MADVKFTVTSDGLVPDLVAMFDEVMAEVEIRIKERTPVKTGNLQNSISVQKTNNGYNIGSDVDYFPYIEFGTSKIAPVAMVRTTLEEIETIIGRTEIKWSKERK